MTGNPVIVPIVEGDGEAKAVPPLLRRILGEVHGRYDIRIQRPINAKGKPKLIGRFEDFLRLAGKKPCDGVLVLLDADDECPVEESTELAERTKSLQLRQPVTIVEANREYETWFVASLDSQQGTAIGSSLGIAETELYHGVLEEVHAKTWLKRKMPYGRTYKETQHQPALTEYIDIEHTRCRSRSFRRLCHAVEELLCAIESGTPIVTP